MMMSMLIRVFALLCMAWVLYSVLRNCYSLWRQERSGRITRTQAAGLLTSNLIGLGVATLMAIGVQWMVFVLFWQWGRVHPTAFAVVSFVLSFVLAGAFGWLYFRFLHQHIRHYFTAEPRSREESTW